MSEAHSSDRKAAFTGLIVGVVALFVIVFVIVKLTNAKYAGHEGAKATASAQR